MSVGRRVSSAAASGFRALRRGTRTDRTDGILFAAAAKMASAHGWVVVATQTKCRAIERARPLRVVEVDQPITATAQLAGITFEGRLRRI